MVRYLTQFIITACLCTASLQLTAQESQVLSGYLLAQSDSTPIPRAHVLNLTIKTGVISNEQGYFTLSATHNDSMLVSVLGYQLLFKEANELNDTIYLVERNYQLELYNVMPYKTFREFKIAFINLNLPDSTRAISKTIYLSKEELMHASYRQTADGGFGIVIPGVISSIFAAFDKRAKDKARVEELMEMDKYEAYLATKFNPSLVKRITELDDPQKLKDFIQYCDFEKDYIRISSKYDIITRTFECYEEYVELK